MNNDLISREALKEDFKSRISICNGWIVNAKDKETKIRASAVKAYIAEVIMTIDNAPTVDTTCPHCDSGYAQGYSDGYLRGKEERPQGEWIPISEKLPNRNGVYMVTRIIDGTRIIDACYFDGQNTWHRDTGVNHGRPYLTDIIAWQPRPEPYKEGNAE